MKTTALDKEQLQRLEAVTTDMLKLIATDAEYKKWLDIMDALPDSLLSNFALLGFMYLGTERARRIAAQSN